MIFIMTLQGFLLSVMFSFFLKWLCSRVGKGANISQHFRKTEGGRALVSLEG